MQRNPASAPEHPTFSRRMQPIRGITMTTRISSSPGTARMTRYHRQILINTSHHPRLVIPYLDVTKGGARAGRWQAAPSIDLRRR